MPIRSLRDKVAVVTGAASGLGAALASGLVREGARVALVDREAAVAQHGLGTAQRAYVVDVADADAVATLRGDVVRDFGSVDLLVNNAGVSVHGAFDSVPLEDVRWLMGVNFWGVVHCTHQFLPLLRTRPEAHVVNVLSLFGWLGLPGKSAYAASKAAVRALSESLRVELQGTGVGVTMLVPSALDTPIVANGRATDASQQEREAALIRRRAIPLERVVARTMRAIRNDQPRVFVGTDARVVELGARLSPSLSQTLAARLLD